MSAGDPRVNPHHPDHEHDWHGDYDDGRYVDDVCQCGAVRGADDQDDECLHDNPVRRKYGGAVVCVECDQVIGDWRAGTGRTA